MFAFDINLSVCQVNDRLGRVRDDIFYLLTMTNVIHHVVAMAMVLWWLAHYPHGCRRMTVPVESDTVRRRCWIDQTLCDEMNAGIKIAAPDFYQNACIFVHGLVKAEPGHLFQLSEPWSAQADVLWEYFGRTVDAFSGKLKPGVKCAEAVPLYQM